MKDFAVVFSVMMAPPVTVGLIEEFSSFLSGSAGWILGACMLIGAVAIQRNQQRLEKKKEK